MPDGRIPGYTCSTRVGLDWIDNGTNCLSRSGSHGPVGTGESDPQKIQFDRTHVYSLSKVARRKRSIDVEIMGHNYSLSRKIDINDDDYLKKLIEKGSGGKKKVVKNARDFQFFILRGGAEGFLSEEFQNMDAEHNVVDWTTTEGKGKTDFDENDLLAVFTEKGTLIASARLRRPHSVTGKISKYSTDMVYNSWDGKTVFVYKNETRGWIPYTGLGVDDGYRGHVTIDLHKEEATNGCILIVDNNTPGTEDPAINMFEPELIKKVLKEKGLVTVKKGDKKIILGKMHVVDIEVAFNRHRN